MMLTGPGKYSLLLVCAVLGLALGLVPGPGLSPLSAEPRREQTQQQLDDLRKRISALQQELAARRSRQSQVQQELQDTETRIGRQVRQLRRLEQELQQQTTRLQALRARQQQQQRELATHSELLAEQIRAAYIVGRQEYLKLLLNQQDPASVGRMVTYYDYFNRSRGERITAARALIASLEATGQAIAEEHQRLTELHAREAAEKQRLEASHQARSRILATINRDIHSRDQQLQQLSENERQLEQLLQGLQRELTDLLRGDRQQPAFAQLRGKLPWPAEGRVQPLFGKQRNSGDLRWSGVLIDSREGAGVRAVARGRVVYADYLRGYGLLLIVDHGDGYMSLYGQNQSLFKEVGDWVDTNETIASVGNSGGQAHSSLYFEIRHKGRPVNPLGWCRQIRAG